MPIYEYHCKECDDTFEKIVFPGSSDFDYSKMPCECGGTGHRKISRVSSLTGKKGSSLADKCRDCPVKNGEPFIGVAIIDKPSEEE